MVEANTDKTIVDPQGYPLPPCIVLERGESLDIWAARARPDRAQAFSVWTASSVPALKLSDDAAAFYIQCTILILRVCWREQGVLRERVYRQTPLIRLPVFRSTG